MHDMLAKLETLRNEHAYVAVVSLDISGAFDHVYHHEVLKELAVRKDPVYLIRIIEDYFKGRRVAVATANRTVDRGCPQGSVLGPILWNIVYDVVLQLLRLFGITVFAFADDTLLLIPAHKAIELQNKINEVMNLIVEEYTKLGLNLNYNKTEVMLFENFPKQMRNDPEWRIDTINVGGHVLEPQDKMKYLGIIFDVQLNFIKHIDYINAKIGKVIKKLSIVFRNTFGYGNAARRIMIKGCILSLIHI